MRKIMGVAVFVTISFAAGGLAAQQMFIFPANGQTPQQQAQDEGACRQWAVQQSGFDPAMAASAPPPSGEATQGGLLRGGARGAAGGAIVGAIAGDAGKGAAMGAAGGAMIGGMRRRDQRRQQDAQAQNWQNQQNAARAGWQRAYTACLQGKGYTVN